MYTKRYMYDAGRKSSLQLIENGFVNAFEETLELMEMNKVMNKEQRGHDKQKPKHLREDTDVMSKLLDMLRRSEEASRSGTLEDSYAARMELANRIRELKGYHWLEEYLYTSGYRILEREGIENAGLKMNALKQLGMLEERRDNTDLALRYMTKSIKVADENSLESDDPNRKELNQHLIRIYQRLGTQCLEKEKDIISVKNSKSIRYYKKAVYLAKLYDTLEHQAISHALLGQAMMKFNDNKRALKNFEAYLELSQECNDKNGICNAYFALSEIYKRMGDLEKTREALIKCQEIAKENIFLIPRIFSSISFGLLETTRRRYTEAHSQFEDAYRILLISENDIPHFRDLHKLCRVICGVGRAHLNFDKLITALRKPPELSLSYILNWRKSGGTFEGKELIERDHLIDLDETEREDAVSERSKIIKQLIDEEVGRNSTVDIPSHK